MPGADLQGDTIEVERPEGSAGAATSTPIPPGPATRRRVQAGAAKFNAASFCATVQCQENFQKLRDENNALKQQQGQLDTSSSGDVSRRLEEQNQSFADRKRKIEAAHRYYGRFDNVYTGPGTVRHGMIEELPCATPINELGRALLICTSQEMVDKLGPYAEMGIDRVIMNVNFGLEAQETLDTIQAFAEEVMPHFTKRAKGVQAAE